MTSPPFSQAGEFVSTGHTVKIDGPVDRVSAYDPRSGDHLWTWSVVFRATPGVETPMLDQENLLLIVGPGCFYCEQLYTPRLATRRCLGEPR